MSWDVARGKEKLVVDHLDNDKKNNSIDNLVPACHSCNTSRGLFANWVMKHKDDPFLAKLFVAANDNKKPFVCEAA
ncbi:HNH endonuclease [compost metagenome]